LYFGRLNLAKIQRSKPRDPGRNAVGAGRGFEAVDLNPLIERGAVKVCEIEGEVEELLYVDYAALLEDGEAMSIALAISRGFHLATDERKARRFFIKATNNADRLISTSQLIRTWAEVRSIPRNDLGGVLALVQSRARYQPSLVDDPNYKMVD
jgi:hypothetical protein